VELYDVMLEVVMVMVVISTMVAGFHGGCCLLLQLL